MNISKNGAYKEIGKKEMNDGRPICPLKEVSANIQAVANAGKICFPINHPIQKKLKSITATIKERRCASAMNMINLQQKERPLHTTRNWAEDSVAKNRIAGFKRPKTVDFIKDEDMPRTPTGKILHRILREKYGKWSDHK